MYKEPEHHTTRSDRLRAHAATRPAPEMRGQLIAAIARGDATELRITSDEYKGFEFVTIRVWNEHNGAWFPDTKRGVTVRPRELPHVIAALERATQGLA